VINIATVHWRTAKWIDPQLHYLERALGVPYRVFASLNGIDDPATAGRFHYAADLEGSHAAKLNQLAGVIAAGAAATDVLIFLDGDAFPVRPLVPWIDDVLSRHPLAAVRRDENLVDRQPHPSFCAVRVREWERLHGDWSPGYSWASAQGKPTTDVGGTLLRALERSGENWTPLLRSNRVNLHPLWFGVYGQIVYHHGAGFRWAVGRVDLANPPRLTTRAKHVPGLGRLLRRRNRARAQRFHAGTAAEAQRLSNDFYQRIVSDPEFYRDLI